MNLTELSAQQLVKLIGEASAELSARMTSPVIERVKAERTLVVLREPTDDDKDFILRIKSVVAAGGYVLARERDRVAEIASDFGPWVARQGLPTERGTGAWRKLAQRSRIPAAQER